MTYDVKIGPTESVGFTGSSDYPMPLEAQRDVVRTLMYKLQPQRVHHGDCINSDAWFHSLCETLVPRPTIYVHPPIIAKKRAFCPGDITYRPKDYMPRNDDIVFASEALIATPHGTEEVRSGTWATIRRARKKGITIFVVYPNGRLEIE